MVSEATHTYVFLFHFLNGNRVTCVDKSLETIIYHQQALNKVWIEYIHKIEFKVDTIM